MVVLKGAFVIYYRVVHFINTVKISNLATSITHFIEIILNKIMIPLTRPRKGRKLQLRDFEYIFYEFLEEHRIHLLGSLAITALSGRIN